MPLSALMTAILEQAKEPLLCLHGAGYFTEDEWIQLDLIMNKRYMWTTGPKPWTQVSRPSLLSAKKMVRAGLREPVLTRPESGGVRISSSPEPTSTSTSVGQSSDDVEIRAASNDSAWELSPAMASPVPTKISIREQAGSSRFSTNGLVTGYALTQLDEARNHNASLTKSKPHTLPGSVWAKHVSSWASEVQQNPIQRHEPRPASFVQKIPVDPDNVSSRGSGRVPWETPLNNYHNDVNVFETSNAAEWDEVPTRNQKSQGQKDMTFLYENKFEKTENLAMRGAPIVKKDVTARPAHPTSTYPSLENRTMQRTATVTRSVRRRDPRLPKEPKDSTYIPPLPKTKTCWFWAESVGGCRYRPEECLNLHVKPKPGMLPNYPLKDGKPTWGSLADATPQEVPEGKRPRSCWFWATKGVCDKGTSCEFVHGWVVGGVASRPRNMAVESSDEEEDSESEEDLVLSGKDIGDKAPAQAANMDPGFIASRIHAPDWIVKAAS